MDINMANLANREMTLNKANVGQDILAKTLEKGAEIKAQQESETTRPVERMEADKQGKIDIYA